MARPPNRPPPSITIARSSLLGVALCAVLANPSPLRADPAAPPAAPVAETKPPATGAALVVTWPEIAGLVEQHPRLRVARLTTDAARAAVDAAGAAPNPTLEGTLGRGLARAGGASRFEWGVSLTVPLGWLTQRGARRSAAHAEVDATVAESAALRREVLLELRTHVWKLAYAQEQVASLEVLAAQTEQLARLVGARVDSGEVRPVEAIRIELERQRVLDDLDGARIALRASRTELARWLEVPPGRTLVVATDLTALPTAPDLTTTLARLRAAHPAVTAARAHVRSLESDVRAEKASRIPNVSVAGFTAYELDRRAYGVGVAVDLPLWNWNAGRIAVAEAALAVGREQVSAAAFDLETTATDLHAACEVATATATRMKSAVLPKAEAAAATMEQTYVLGEIGLLELLDARRTLLDARQEELLALVHAQIACSRLGALVGEDPP